MPIYEYEPTDHDCVICSGRVEVLQKLDEAPLEFCPTCGLGVRRVISRASIEIRTTVDPEGAAKRGFTTFKRNGKGTYERIAGEGPDLIQGSGESAEPKPKKKIVDLGG